MGPQHTACFISPFWPQNFGVAPTFLENNALLVRVKVMVNLRNLRYLQLCC